jgi:hypothetical protein
MKNYEITEKQIREIETWGNSKDAQKVREEWFPEVFETKFKNGWYNHSEGRFNKWIIYADFENNTSYGIVTDGNWSTLVGLEYVKNHCELATDSEVLEALTNEAIKIGFKKGVAIKNHQGEFILNDLDIVFTKEHNNGIWTRQEFGVWLFYNGVWAEIIKTYTKEEAEKLLNVKII